MKRLRSTAMHAMWLSLFGLVISPPFEAMAEARAQEDPNSSVVDIAMDSDGVLHGVLVDREASPVQGKVLVWKGGEALGTVSSAGDGRFRVRLPAGGTYQVATADQMITIRAWTPNAAPPNSTQQLVLVQGDVLRGQRGAIPLSTISPWVIAGVAAAAIGIPVILANHRDDRGDGS